MSVPAFGLSTIGQILVPVSDVERSTAFYRDGLGLRFLFDYPGFAFFDADGVRLMLEVIERPDVAGRLTVYFRVPDIEAAVAALEARGVTFPDRPHIVHRDPAYDLWMAFTADPDGNIIGLMEERPSAR